MTFELDDSRPHRLITKAMLGHVHLWIEKREKQKDGPLFEPDVLGHELAKGIGANEKAVFLPYDDFLKLSIRTGDGLEAVSLLTLSYVISKRGQQKGTVKNSHDSTSGSFDHMTLPESYRSYCLCLMVLCRCHIV